MFKFMCGTTFGFMTCLAIVGCAYAASVAAGIAVSENDTLREVVHNIYHSNDKNVENRTLHESSDYKA